MIEAALPRRSDERFRYADLAALAPLWPVAVERIAVAPGAERSISITSLEQGDTVRELALEIGAEASLDLRLLCGGGGYCRIAVHAELGAGARLMLGAAQLAGRGQTVELVTTVVHAAPGAVSRQVVRSLAGERASASYLGKVRVLPGADGTDGEQSVRAMLLHPTARANARPELEILADDVKCAHGCAVGELDPQGLFYMAARGLPPGLAKKLLLQAFLAEAFEGAGDQDHLLEQALDMLEELV